MTDHRSKAVDATGTSTVAVSVDNNPGYGAVDAPEPERRNLNAQTTPGVSDARPCPHCCIRPALSGEPNCYCDPDDHGDDQ